MKFAIAFLAVLFPAFAFAQVLPLEDVVATRVFGHHIKGPIHHLDNSMKPSKQGHAGYEPKKVIVGPGAYATANSSDSDMKYYIDIQTESGFDTIVYSGDQAKLFIKFLMPGKELNAGIESLVLIDPADGDYKSDIIYLGAYDAKGNYVGQATVPRGEAAKAVAAMALAATPEKPAA